MYLFNSFVSKRKVEGLLCGSHHVLSRTPPVRSEGKHIYVSRVGREVGLDVSPPTLDEGVGTDLRTEGRVVPPLE